MSFESYYMMVFATIGVMVTALWIGVEITDRRAKRKKPNSPHP